MRRKHKYKEELSELVSKSKEKRFNRERDMTVSVQTRWYRAPEIILTERSYN